MAPVVDAVFVVNLFSKPINDLSRSPSDSLLHLLIVHLLEKRQEELLQLDVALIGDQNVSDSAMTVESVFDIVHVEFSQMEGAHAFHQILFNSTCSCNDAVDHAVLSKISNDITHTTGSHIGSIPEEDCASGLSPIGRVAGFFIIPFVKGLIRESPANHAVDNLNSLLEMGGLKASGGIALEDVLIVDSFVEVVSSYRLSLKLLVLVEEFLDLLFHVLGTDYL